jgi:two-component system, NarL family, sensor kinase
MSTRTTAWVAWSACALSLSLMAFGLLVTALGWSTPLPGVWLPWMNQAIEALGVIGAPILGGLIASRRPQNPYGWLWLGIGAGWALTSFAHAYGV